MKCSFPKFNFVFMRAAISMIIAILSVPTYAATIFDTGTPSADAGWTFASGQYFAGEFSLSAQTNVTSTDAWFSNLQSGVAGTVSIQIFTDGGNIPGTQLYAQTFSVPAYSSLNWYGISNLNWNLSAGTYWVAFIPDANIYGSMPGYAPSPLDEYAQHSGGAWQDNGLNYFDYLKIGMRMSGEAVPETPLPATLPLFATGLGTLGLLGWRRKRKAAALAA